MLDFSTFDVTIYVDKTANIIRSLQCGIIKRCRNYFVWKWSRSIKVFIDSILVYPSQDRRFRSYCVWRQTRDCDELVNLLKIIWNLRKWRKEIAYCHFLSLEKVRWWSCPQHSFSLIVSAHSAKTYYGWLLVMDRVRQYPVFSQIWPRVAHTKIQISVFLDVSDNYRPQRKVMFSEASVSHSVHIQTSPPTLDGDLSPLDGDPLAPATDI